MRFTINFLVFFLVSASLVLSCKKDSNEITDNKSLKDKNYLFKSLPTSQTGINFSNDLVEDADHSIINYIYFYNGAGVAAGDINNDGLPDLYFASNQGENKLFINKGNLQFEDVTSTANVNGNSSWNTGVTMVDINDDGLLDIYVCSVSGLLDFTGTNELFINNGNSTFTEKAAEYGLDFKGYSTQSYFFDYDKDGDLDVYIVNHAVHTSLSHGPAEARNTRVPLVGDALLRNDNGKFVDVSEEAKIYGGVNGYGLSAAIADFNNDGWDDIYVCNDFHEDDYYYINNQDGTFIEDISSAFATISRFSMGSDVADINGDGNQDLITLDMLPKSEKVLKETEGDDAMLNMQDRLRNLGYKDQYARNMLQINNDGDFFTEEALINDVADTDWSWGALFADFNNDTHQDLFISNGILRRPNGLDFRMYVSNAFKNRNPTEATAWLYNSINEMPEGIVTNELFEGDRNKFHNKTGDWIEDKPSLSNGAIYIDLDLDGDLDLVTNNLNELAGVYENTLEDDSFVGLNFDYLSGNREGIGTKAIVYSKNDRQLKQLFKSRGFLSSTNAQLHFGLATASQIDSIQVIWPNNRLQTLIEPASNTYHNINYSDDSKPYVYNTKEPSSQVVKKVDLIKFDHQEDPYNDFKSEKLIPYKVSTLGPAVAIADIDGNGFKDVFLGNAADQKAQLFMNNGSKFTSIDQPFLTTEAKYEDNAAVFFDADNDSDLDLYVASGFRSSAFRNASLEKDRLYINNNGVFTINESAIPQNRYNTSVVCSYDFDADGDEDLFIGNYTSPGDFGIRIPSFILRNNNGQFVQHPDFELKANVTSAIWEDIDGNGLKDLLITTEWDTPKLYLNDNGVLSEQNLPAQLNGLWKTSILFDIDGDGDQDWLLGNWGLNTKFNPTAEHPLRMYHSDFDANGKTETVLAYYREGDYYPVNSKDELASQMTVIKKRFTDHSQFSLQPIEAVLTSEGIRKATLREVHTLASGYLENNNGQFDRFVAFPEELQLSSINTFQEIKMNGESYLIVAGNNKTVNSYHGAYLSNKGYVFKNLNSIRLATDYGFEPMNEQVKDLSTIQMKNGTILMISNNSAALKTYLIKEQ